jgi:hypothetical protein
VSAGRIILTCFALGIAWLILARLWEWFTAWLDRKSSGPGGDAWLRLQLVLCTIIAVAATVGIYLGLRYLHKDDAMLDGVDPDDVGLFSKDMLLSALGDIEIWAPLLAMAWGPVAAVVSDIRFHRRLYRTSR